MDTRAFSQEPLRRTPVDRHAELPVDPDVDASRGDQRPIHVRFRYVYVVALGGALGTASRYGLELALPAPAGLPVPTLLINLAGAFLLGLLLEELVRRGPDRGWLRLTRLHAGTGFLGAFTTYSAFSVETLGLFRDGRVPAGLAYLATTIVGGALLTAVGITVGSARHARAGAS